MSLLDCILLGLAAMGIVLAVVIVAAIIVVLTMGTAGTGGPFAAAVVALLASWWVPIAGSLVAAFALNLHSMYRRHCWN
jgi:predicted acyltransferase